MSHGERLSQQNPQNHERITPLQGWKQDSPKFSALANAQRAFEAIEPARAGNPALSYVLETLMRFAAEVMADF
jgi:hypothetical protein